MNAEELLDDYREALDHEFLGDGRSHEHRSADSEKARNALLDALTKPIMVWDWDDAPEELKALSPHGGDEDWLALVPKHYASRCINWMETGGSFGCCDVSEHELPDGSVVRIGAHA